MWLLDTNAWIAYLEHKPNSIKAQIVLRSEADILMCDVVKAELLYGAYKSSRVEQNLAKLSALFSLIKSLPFDGIAAREFGEIRAYLSRLGTPIGPYDLQIHGSHAPASRLFKVGTLDRWMHSHARA